MQRHTVETKAELFEHVVEKVPCSTCNARLGCHCTTSSGKPTEPHLERHIAHVKVCNR